MKFYSCTFLPDGQIYDSGSICISDYIENGRALFSSSLSLDSQNRKATIVSDSGELQFVWCGSHNAGVFSFFLNDVLVNSGLCLPGNDPETEIQLLQFYIGKWHNFKVVKDLGTTSPFSSALKEQQRPFLCNVNWATVEPNIYNTFANYDLYLSSLYFENVGGPQART